jgi:putative ABC transport system substrate-binding protein
MLRRRFVGTVLAATAVGASGFAARGAGKPPIVGFLAGANRSVHVADMAGLRAGLAEVGLVEGESIAIEERYADGDRSRIDGLIQDLVALDTAVFLVPGLVAARAVSNLTQTPMVTVALPWSNRHPDLFKALSKPGGSITGFSLGSEGLSAKRIQLLREAMPGLASLAVLHNGADPIYGEWGIETEAAAQDQGLTALRLELHKPDPPEVERLIRQAAADGAQAIIVIRDFLTTTMTPHIVAAANAAGLATLSEQRDFCMAGGMLSYGANVPDLFRRSAAFIAKILEGANPGDLPIQLPTKFDFVVNVLTAEALGLDLPPELFL